MLKDVLKIFTLLGWHSEFRNALHHYPKLLQKIWRKYPDALTTIATQNLKECGIWFAYQIGKKFLCIGQALFRFIAPSAYVVSSLVNFLVRIECHGDIPAINQGFRCNSGTNFLKDELHVLMSAIISLRSIVGMYKCKLVDSTTTIIKQLASGDGQCPRSIVQIGESSANLRIWIQFLAFLSSALKPITMERQLEDQMYKNPLNNNKLTYLGGVNP
jgi:hypothetical protein